MSPWIPFTALLAFTGFYIALSLFILVRVFGNITLKRGD